MLQTATNNNSHQGLSRTPSVSSVNSQLSTEPDALGTNPSVLVAPERGAAIYNAPNSTSITDEAYRDSDTASIASSAFHSEARLSEMQSRFQQVHRLARGYKEKNKQLINAYKALERERDQLKQLMEANQTKALRRVDELRDELELDKKAKHDVEVNYTLMLSEKDEMIRVLRQQVTLLKEGKDLPDDLKEVIEAGHARELERKRSMVQQNRELVNKVGELEAQLQLTTTQLQEHVVKRNELHQQVINYEKLKEQAAKDTSGVVNLRRELTDKKLANEALEQQVRGLKEQLTNLLSSATAANSSTTTTVETTEEDHPNNLANRLSKLQSILETEQARRKQAETELTRERQDAQAQELLIEQLRATIEQNTSRALDKTCELQAIKKDLEGKQLQLLEISDSLKKEQAQRAELETQLNVKNLRLTELEQKAALVSDLEERIVQLTAVEQECELLRQQIHEFDQLEAYVLTQVLRMEQVAQDVFAPDSTNPDVVTSSTASKISERTEDSGGSTGLKLSQGIEKLVSVLNRMGSELAQRDRREMNQIQQVAEHEVAMTQLKETYGLQQRELESQFALEKSAFEGRIRSKTKQVEELQNQLGEVGVQLATLQSRLAEATQEAQIKEKDASKLSEIRVHLEQQLAEQKAQCNALESKIQQLTQKNAHLQSERDELLGHLEESWECAKQVNSDQVVSDHTRVDTQSHHDSNSMSKLVCLKQSVQSVRESIDQIRDECALYQTRSLKQILSEMNHCVELIQSAWNSHVIASQRSDQTANENQRLQSEVLSLRERLITIEQDREQTNVQLMLLREQADQTAERLTHADLIREKHRQLTDSHQATVAELDSVRAKLTEFCTTGQTEHEQLVRERDELKHIVDECKIELTEFRQRLEQDQARQCNLEVRLADERAHAEELKAQLNQAMLDRESAHQALMEFDANVNTVLSKQAADAQRWTHLNETTQQLAQRLTFSESRVEQLMQDNEARTVEHQSHLDAANLEIARLSALFNQAQTEAQKSGSIANAVSALLMKAISSDAQDCLARVKRVSLEVELIGSPSSLETEQLTVLRKSLLEIQQKLTALTASCANSDMQPDSPLAVLLARLTQDSHTITELETRVNHMVREKDREHSEIISQVYNEARSEIARLTEQCTHSADTERLLEQTVSTLTTELDTLRNADLARCDELMSAQSVLETVQQRLSTTEKQLAETHAIGERRESDLQEKETQIAHLEAKLTEMSRANEVQTSEKQSQLETMATTHAEAIQQIRLDYDRKLADQMHKTNEERTSLVQSHQTQLQELQESFSSKEKQWKQQIKVNADNHQHQPLHWVVLFPSFLRPLWACDDLLWFLFFHVTFSIARQIFYPLLIILIVPSPSFFYHPPSPLYIRTHRAHEILHSNFMDEIREQYQKEMEALKAEHALHTQDMQTEFQLQLRGRETELRVDFDQKMGNFKRISFQTRVYIALDFVFRFTCFSLVFLVHCSFCWMPKAAATEESERTATKLVDERNHLMESVNSAKNEIDILRARISDLESALECARVNDSDSNSVSRSVSKDDPNEVQRLRDEVARLTTQLQTQSRALDQPLTSTHASTDDQRTDVLTVQTEVITPIESGARLTVHPPIAHEPLVAPKSSNWVEELRNQILQAESIDSLHPSVRSNPYLTSVSIEEYEALQCHNADLQNQLQQLSADFEALRANCTASNGPHSHYTPSGLFETSSSVRQFSFPPTSPGIHSPMGVLQEMVEYEYLKNVLFEYMIGRETGTLAKVLCSIMKFNSEQTKKVLQYEDIKSRTWTLRTVD
ncbi:Golgin subfamily A member 4 [Fasciola gigantica]|uniref:Golgin subfamily A member 4 n=1 Tax=Fasciola gigantica TaxID=46835 RepID=A0A504YMB5_FASGI|nr:Golgin subfamily A member 4 [Fasciola gigantica]